MTKASTWEELVQILGRPDACALVCKTGGERIYFPQACNINSDHRLAKSLGRARAIRISKALAGSSFRVPKMSGVRRKMIVAGLHLISQGDTELVSIMAGISQRRVQQIIANKLTTL